MFAGHNSTPEAHIARPKSDRTSARAGSREYFVRRIPTLASHSPIEVQRSSSHIPPVTEATALGAPTPTTSGSPKRAPAPRSTSGRANKLTSTGSSSSRTINSKTSKNKGSHPLSSASSVRSGSRSPPSSPTKALRRASSYIPPIPLDEDDDPDQDGGTPAASTAGPRSLSSGFGMKTSRRSEVAQEGDGALPGGRKLADTNRNQSRVTSSMLGEPPGSAEQEQDSDFYQGGFLGGWYNYRASTTRGRATTTRRSRISVSDPYRRKNSGAPIIDKDNWLPKEYPSDAVASMQRGSLASQRTRPFTKGSSYTEQKASRNNYLAAVSALWDGLAAGLNGDDANASAVRVDGYNRFLVYANAVWEDVMGSSLLAIPGEDSYQGYNHSGLVGAGAVRPNNSDSREGAEKEHFLGQLATGPHFWRARYHVYMRVLPTLTGTYSYGQPGVVGLLAILTVLVPVLLFDCWLLWSCQGSNCGAYLVGGAGTEGGGGTTVMSRLIAVHLDPYLVQPLTASEGRSWYQQLSSSASLEQLPRFQPQTWFPPITENPCCRLAFRFGSLCVCLFAYLRAKRYMRCTFSFVSLALLSVELLLGAFVDFGAYLGIMHSDLVQAQVAGAVLVSSSGTSTHEGPEESLIPPGPVFLQLRASGLSPWFVYLATTLTPLFLSVSSRTALRKFAVAIVWLSISAVMLFTSGASTSARGSSSSASLQFSRLVVADSAFARAAFYLAIRAHRLLRFPAVACAVLDSLLLAGWTALHWLLSGPRRTVAEVLRAFSCLPLLFLVLGKGMIALYDFLLNMRPMAPLSVVVEGGASASASASSAQSRGEVAAALRLNAGDLAAGCLALLAYQYFYVYAFDRAGVPLYFVASPRLWTAPAFYLVVLLGTLSGYRILQLSP